MKIQKKYFLICLTLLVLSASCVEIKNSDVGTGNDVSNATDINDEAALTEKELIPSWIDTVIMHSPPRTEGSTINLDSDVFFLDDIDSTFFLNHLYGFKTDFPRTWTIEFDPFSRYYFFDYQRNQSWVSFTIMHVTEYGYTDLYTYTYDEKLKQIISVSCIAQTGSDGQAWSKDYLFFTDSGRKLTVRTQAYYTEDSDHDGGLDYCYTQMFDSIVSNFHFSQERTAFAVDTIFSKLDTICY